MEDLYPNFLSDIFDEMLAYETFYYLEQIEYEKQQEEKEDYYYSIQDSFKDRKKYRR